VVEDIEVAESSEQMSQRYLASRQIVDVCRDDLGHGTTNLLLKGW